MTSPALSELQEAAKDRAWDAIVEACSGLDCDVDPDDTGDGGAVLFGHDRRRLDFVLTDEGIPCFLVPGLAGQGFQIPGKEARLAEFLRREADSTAPTLEA